MLVSYCPVKSKVVLLLSTKHQTRAINQDSNNKSDVILFYNSIKGGVDSVDQMARRYSVKRKTRRWTMSLFFTQIDIAGINAYAIHKALCPHSKICSDRMTFLILMGQNLGKTFSDCRNPHFVQLKPYQDERILRNRTLR